MSQPGHDASGGIDEMFDRLWADVQDMTREYLDGPGDGREERPSRPERDRGDG